MTGDDFQVGDHTYSAGRLDAFKQLHCSRRIAPLIKSAAPILTSLPTNETGTPVLSSMADLLTVSGPMLDAIAQLRDEDVDYVISTCLSVTSRKQGGGYAPVWVSGGLMFSDITMIEMLRICARVLQDNIGPFSFGPASKSVAA